MTEQKAFRQLKDRFERLEKNRRELQTVSMEIQRLSKQAIFALQRQAMTEATRILEQARDRMATGRRCIGKESRLASEGMWRAALEEYTEATLFFCSEQNAELLTASTLSEDPDIVIGALSDVVGEMVRRAVARATDGNRAAVEQLYQKAQRVVAFLTSLDLTGSLRSKGDQSRQHLRRLEDIRYDLSRRV